MLLSRVVKVRQAARLTSPLTLLLVVALVLSIISILIALAGAGLTLWIERKRRPDIHIEAAQWRNPNVPWNFAAVNVFNPPLGGIWGRLLTRRSAEGCRVSFMVRKQGSADPLVRDFPGRWSGTPEPFRQDVRQDADGNWIQVEMFDHTLVPDSFRFDVPSTGEREEVAVAVWRDNRACLFNSSSYAAAGWYKPEWALASGVYDVTARVSATGSEASAALILTVGDEDAFDLRPSP